jgi:probable F420-dependent oxidoreductase
MATPMPLTRMQALARDAAAAGFSGLVITEAGRTAYLGCAAAALAAPDLDILTGVAVAFPRSPMVTAQVAWELADATRGRFRLGLGTQVRAHVERRYGSEFDPPGPRLRDYVLALRAIFDGFRGEPLSYEGDYWNLTLLPAMWSPGPIDVPDPAIDIAAVNPWMLRLAGEVADGLHVHPLNNPTYLEQTVVPELTAGATRAGRSLDDLSIIVPTFAAPSDEWREMARMQVAFYGSTPNYAFLFEQLGRDGTTAKLREKQKAGDIAGMAAVIDDELLDHSASAATGRTSPTGSSTATAPRPTAWSPTSRASPGSAIPPRSARGASWPGTSSPAPADLPPTAGQERSRNAP